MAQFDEYFAEAIERGTGRAAPPGRLFLPLLLPEGDQQDTLFAAAIDHAKGTGFHLLDVREISYERALAQFVLPWPRVSAGYPPEGHFYKYVAKSDTKLLIIGGTDPEPVFWGHLNEEAVLYAGASFPYYPYIVVPDRATVIAIVKARDYPLYRNRYFGPIYRYGLAGDD